MKIDWPKIIKGKEILITRPKNLDEDEVVISFNCSCCEPPKPGYLILDLSKMRKHFIEKQENS